jgi:hypothetical protein
LEKEKAPPLKRRLNFRTLDLEEIRMTPFSFSEPFISQD